VKLFLKITISILLTASFLVLFLRSFDLGAAVRSLQAASPLLLALSVLVNLFGYLIRAWRWRWLLAPVRPGLGMYNLTSTTFIGFMVSFLVPFRVGEVVRPVLLARRERLSAGSALATIALERLLDALSVMSLFLVFVLTARGAALLHGAPSAGQAARLLRHGLAAAAIFVAVGLPLLILLVAFPGRVVTWVRRVLPVGRLAPLARLIDLMDNFAAGLAVLRRGRELAGVVAQSIALWLVIDLSVFIGLKAFGLPLRITDVFLLMVPLAVGIAVPTPGGVGPYEFLGQVSLSGFFAVPAADAAAAAVTLHAIALLPTIVIGLAFMWRDGLRPSEVRTVAAAGPAGRGNA